MVNDPLISKHEVVEIRNEKLLLLPEKAIYWTSKKLLLIADLHLGKSAHFRKNGIAVPKTAVDNNWLILHRLFKKYEPQRVCFLGDLFHSTHNKSWEVFKELIESYSQIRFELVLGNHDILPTESYEKIGFKVVETLLEEPFLLSHEPLKQASPYYNLAGHIHPGIKLRGKGKQTHRLACFYFGENGGLLPAFGVFTGLANVSAKKSDAVFAIAGEQVIKI
jgi:DNA ligase-associated metallophosphoesterase